MASKVPPALKVVAPFITRGSQIEKADPVISYYCLMYAAQIILSRSLHESDPESKTFAMNLLDQLEQKKDSLAGNEVLGDDVVAQAYIETFAMKIFTNADNAQRARKCSKQTADTFLAAATFMELSKLFGELDLEVQAKVKYAKFHATRIIKAINAGEDPNLPEEEKPEEEQDAPADSAMPSSPPRQPTVEEVTDEGHKLELRMARTSITDESLHPSRGVSPLPPPQHQQQQHQQYPSSPPRQPSQPPHQTPQDQRLPYQHSIEPSSASSNRPPEVSSYFPPAPPDYLRGLPSGPTVPPQPPSGAFDLPSAPPSGFNLPSSPSHQPQSRGSFDLPSAPTGPAQPSVSSPFDLPSAPTGPAQSGGGNAGFDLPSAPNNQPDDFYSSMSSTAPPPQPPPIGAMRDEGPPQTAYSMPHNVHHHPTPHHPPHPPHPPHSQPQQYQQPPPPQGYGYGGPPHPPPSAGPPAADNLIDPEVDAELIPKAQKHAKFAISALNYDDIPTAVKELRAALKTLGARV